MHSATRMRQTICALSLLVAACGGAVTDDLGKKDAGEGTDSGSLDSSSGADASVRVPLKHRATATACPTARGSMNGTWGDAGNLGDCSSDSDCTAGTNGRCIPGFGGAFHLQCSYDECSNDTMCPGTVCVCRADATSSNPNVCGSSASNCRVDADCGPSGFCSPTESSNQFCYGEALTYACHTPADECVDDSDCGADGSCNYDPSAAHWKCGSLCLPPPP